MIKSNVILIIYNQSCMKLAQQFARAFCSKPTISPLVSSQHFTQLQCQALVRKQNFLRNMILQQIDVEGQMKMEKYWQLALTDPHHGYYADQNVFSKSGDFTTAPEISSLFGQMLGVWIVYFLQKTNVIDKGTHKLNKRFRIVELGGGRGLLMKDIVNSFRDVQITDGFDINFVEVSEFNRKSQQDSVMDAFKKGEHFFRFEHELADSGYESFVSENQEKSVNLKWHPNLQSIFYHDSEAVKKGEQIPFTIFVMNQFMDALPTTILQYTQDGWRQKVFVRSNKEELYLQLGISKNSPHQKLIPVTDEPPALNQEIQISPQSLLTMDLMAKIINKYGGAILNVDYGGDGHYNDSIRGIKEHKYVPSPYLWQIPGQCDLSAYVNFAILGQFAKKNEGIVVYETIPQGYFLEAMGIVHRVDILKEKADKQTRQRLDSEQERLVDPSQMGQIYKVQIITKEEYGDIYPFIQIDQNSF